MAGKADWTGRQRKRAPITTDESSHHCEQWLSATRLTPKEQNPSELTTTVIHASQKMKSYCHDLHRRETVSHAKSAKPFIDLSCWRISKRNGNIHLQRNSWWAFVCWMTSEWISKHLQDHSMTSKFQKNRHKPLNGRGDNVSSKWQAIRHLQPFKCTINKVLKL